MEAYFSDYIKLPGILLVIPVLAVDTGYIHMVPLGHDEIAICNSVTRAYNQTIRKHDFNYISIIVQNCRLKSNM